MENKDKEKKQLDKKEHEVQKKQKENKDDDLRLTPEDLKKFIEELKDRYNIDEENIRIVKIERRKPNPKQILLSFLFSYFSDFILIISLNGYLGFAPYEFFRILLFSVIFSTTEILIRELMMKYYPKLMFYSFGTILFPITITALIFAWWVTPGLKADSYNNLVVFFIIFLILRVVINFLLMKRNRDKMFRKIKGGK